MARSRLSRADHRQIDAAVRRFERNLSLFETAAKQLHDALSRSQDLAPYIHFMKYRAKDAEHLRRKLQKRALRRKAKGKEPDVSERNLFTKIGDLAGVRILHLHTDQIEPMKVAIREILEEHRYRIREGPTAIVWDREYAQLFAQFGIKVEPRDSMYTSVHYVVQANQRTPITVELQVRTLMEEVWGEVSHRVDYPEELTIRACRDQLKVLARMTSGCTRLVDSIFKSQAENQQPASPVRRG